MNLTVGQTQWALPAGQEAIAQYTEDSITLQNFVLQRGAQRLTAAGTVAVGSGSANLANNLNVRLDNVQVRDLNELLLGNRSLEGVLNATAEIRGTRHDPIVASEFALTGGRRRGREVHVADEARQIIPAVRSISTRVSSRTRRRSSPPLGPRLFPMAQARRFAQKNSI